MVSAIKTHIEKLEAENKSLKEQQVLLEQVSYTNYHHTCYMLDTTDCMLLLC